VTALLFSNRWQSSDEARFSEQPLIRFPMQTMSGNAADPLFLYPPPAADFNFLPTFTDDRLPGRSDMALFATPPEQAVMLVILVMATGTTGRQFQFTEYRCLVTVATL
jgi:hypothetical protein